MNKIAIAVHGGAGEDSAFIKKHLKEYETGLENALREGYSILENGGNAVDAVRAAVVYLENNPLFNAGKGSALYKEGKVEMDAAIMDGNGLKAGAVALATNVKNPIELAHRVMYKTNHVLLAGAKALEFAQKNGLAIEEDDYFKTPHQWEELKKAEGLTDEDLERKQKKGTVGAVALDSAGNLAAATSTGGTPGSLSGRVGDSCIIGAGCFADNNTCAVSGTGDGEYLITGVIAHSISMVLELKSPSLQEACDQIIHEKNKDLEADIGVISVNRNGEIGISYNSEMMHRGWIDSSGVMHCKTYK
jgi:L-asparaginase / beta-aspartyl-peptidase